MAADLVDRPAPAPVRTGSLTRMPGLDGVRAVAVTAVLVFHANPSWLPGGFLGVDVFFTLSGFLITWLLLAELDAHAAAALRPLLPPPGEAAAAGAVPGPARHGRCSPIIARDATEQFAGDVLAALLYVTNWWYVVHGTTYFEATGRPPLLQHLWSLAVEEQFYLVWPLLLVGLLAARRARAAVRVAAVGGALLSTAADGADLGRDGIPDAADSGRVYFGTDTHAMTLLVGAVLATCWTPDRSSRPSPLEARRC